MCRFLVYKGDTSIVLSNLLLEPTHSILKQSYDCRLRPQYHLRPHNGDGFGLGYYPDPALSAEPCLFTTITPAWNCLNFARLATKTASKTVFAHVRATLSKDISQQNCHPFQYKTIMFMHNGGVAGWSDIKRAVAGSVADAWFSHVQGTTDSEWCFALFLDSMEKLGVPPSVDPGAKGYGPAILRKALLLTIERVVRFTSQLEPNESRSSKLNFAITDGVTVVCSRYCDSPTEEPTSLFFTSGTHWRRDHKPGQSGEDDAAGEFRMHRDDKSNRLVVLASEPLTFYRDNWVPVPANSVLTIHQNYSVMIQPIVDDFYNLSPGVIRPRQPGAVRRDAGPTAGQADSPLSAPLTCSDMPSLYAGSGSVSDSSLSFAPSTAGDC